jgi:hypothetical protein
VSTNLVVVVVGQLNLVFPQEITLVVTEEMELLLLLLEHLQLMQVVVVVVLIILEQEVLVDLEVVVLVIVQLDLLLLQEHIQPVEAVEELETLTLAPTVVQE